MQLFFLNPQNWKNPKIPEKIAVKNPNKNKQKS